MIGAFSELRGRGFNVIPIIYGDKKPAIKWSEYQTKLVTLEQCKEWEGKRYNVGIVTGAISGVFVLDVDGEAGAATLATLEAQHGSLPETLTATSGKGKHYYFPYPDDGRIIRNLAGQSVDGEVLEGLDVRGEGGYIIAPPSLHPNGKHYQWLNDLPPATAPDWLLDLVVQSPVKSLLDDNHVDNTVDKLSYNNSYVQTALDNELQELRNSTEGQRNNDLNKSAYSLGQLVAHGLNEHKIASELLQIALLLGLDASESMKTISSGLQKGKCNPRPLTKPNIKNKTLQPWQPPQLFDSYNPPPLNPELLPAPLCPYVKAVALATETPVCMSIACVLAMVSIAVTGKFQVQPKAGWKESLNLYWFVELPPANRKSAVFNACTTILSTWEAQQAKQLKASITKAKSNHATIQKRIEKLRKDYASNSVPEKRESLANEVDLLELELEQNPIPNLPRLFGNNLTPEALENAAYEQGGIFGVLSDEGGIVETLTGLYSNGKANVDIILKGIDGGALRIKRKERDIMMQPYLTFLLVVQPKIREKMGANQAMQGNGALERFLYVIPKSTIGYRTHTTPAIPQALQNQYDNLIMELLNIPYLNEDNIIQTLKYDEAGSAALLAFQLWLEPQLKQGGAYYALQGWGGKIAGFIVRISALLHIVATKGNSHVISLQVVNNAIELGYMLLEHAKAAFALMRLDDVVRHSIHIIDWIKAQGLKSFTRSELTTAMRHTMKKEAIDAAITELTERHILQAVEVQAANNKPATHYHINPALLE